LFVARLPYVGHDELHERGAFANLLEDSFGLLCLGVLVYLTEPLRLARRVSAKRARRSPAMTSATRR